MGGSFLHNFINFNDWLICWPIQVQLFEFVKKVNLPFEIINNIDKRLTRLREKREDSKNKNRNEKRDTTIDSTEIQNIMRD